MRMPTMPAPACTPCYLTGKGNVLAVNTIRYTLTVSHGGGWSVTVHDRGVRPVVARGEELREMGVCAVHDDGAGTRIAASLEVFSDMDQAITLESQRDADERLAIAEAEAAAEARRLEAFRAAESLPVEEPEDHRPANAATDDDDDQEDETEGDEPDDDYPGETWEGMDDPDAPDEDYVKQKDDEEFQRAAVASLTAPKPEARRTPPMITDPFAPKPVATVPKATPRSTPATVAGPATVTTIKQPKKNSTEWVALMAWYNALPGKIKNQWREIPPGAGRMDQELLKAWVETDEYIKVRAELEMRVK